jgi:peptidoglycan/LPS O-acetylase OafA/YrhL
LDGVRGLLAIWVYLGHVANAVGLHQYVLAAHALAVDFFMILSGFLMVHTWKASLNEPTFKRQTTLRFYIARFFRIAPLYYVLLLACYVILPTLSFMQAATLKTIPPPWAATITNYAPSLGWNFDSVQWLLLHLSFGFGLVPGMEASTPLPDWSLSLEMQFYLVLPLLIVLFARVPIILLTTAAATLAIGAPAWFGNYLEVGSVAHFGQPSVLAYRLNAFIAGMLIGYVLKRRSQQSTVFFSRHNIYLIVCAAICVAPLSKPVILGFFCLAALAIWRIPIVTAILSVKSLRQLGDISYSVYLSHLLVVIPMIYWLIQNAGFMAQSTVWRFVLAVAVTAPMIFITSYLLNKTIEQPGIKLGKWLTKRV